MANRVTESHGGSAFKRAWLVIGVVGMGGGIGGLLLYWGLRIMAGMAALAGFKVHDVAMLDDPMPMFLTGFVGGTVGYIGLLTTAMCAGPTLRAAMWCHRYPLRGHVYMRLS